MEFEVKVPILGFSDVQKVKLEKVDDLFTKLENVDDVYPSFMLVNPFAFRDYDFEIPAAVKVLLGLREKTNLLVMNIMIIQEPIEESTINFIAPIVFNFDNSTMGQVVLDSTKYPQYGITEPISNYIDSNNIK
ncbi:MAG: flagellar assembly protein FliW [Campylobacterales bacterium]